MNVRSIFIYVIAVLAPIASCACTSMIVSAKASASGRPLLWKHRDCSCESNFIERIDAKDGNYGYIALFNAGDSLLAEAWIGVNDTDFAIMNTASYNLAPDTATYKDREGFIITEALKRCATVDDFEQLLNNMAKPLGVQANFGVIDAMGNGAYFETDDYTYRKYDLKQTSDGVLVRTNFSESGNNSEGYGYIRYRNTYDLLQDKITAKTLTPADLTEGVSRSFYHSLIGHDFATDSVRWVIDQDFVPRNSSTASIVIEGAAPGDLRGARSVMWTALGYPPCAVVKAVTADKLPKDLRPVLPGFKSPASEAAAKLKLKAFPIKRGNGSHYIDMDFLRPVIQKCHRQSMINYGR